MMIRDDANAFATCLELGCTFRWFDLEGWGVEWTTWEHVDGITGVLIGRVLPFASRDFAFRFELPRWLEEQVHPRLERAPVSLEAQVAKGVRELFAGRRAE